MTDIASVSVPLKNREALFIPPFSEYAAMMDKNSAIPEEEKKKRRAVKEELLKIAYDYTKGLGLDPGPPPDPEKPVIAAGHQPVPFHPGIAIKSIALVREAKRLGATPLFISVDSDEFRNGKIFFPSIENGKLTRHVFRLFESDGSLFENAAPLFDNARFIAELEKLAGEYSEEKFKSVKTSISEFLFNVKEKNPPENNLVEKNIVLRRIWQVSCADSFCELPVSKISSSKAFVRFAKEIIFDIKRFSAIYNDELARYRKKRKLRYKANPFPDLAITDEWIETPFWIVDGKSREPLFAKPDNQPTLVKGISAPEMSIDQLFDSDKWGIRPKAISLSLFLRLYLCELFIHGVGGAKYDNVTDGIIRACYQKEPPLYSCVSATLFCVESPGEDPAVKIAETRKKLRDIEQKPESMSNLADYDITSLVEEKSRLIALLKTPGAERKMVGKKIAQLNRDMAKALDGERKKLSETLEKLSNAETEYEAATARDYPYFFFSAKKVAALLP